MFRPGATGVRVTSTIRRLETSQTGGTRKAAGTDSTATTARATQERPLRFGANPQVKLMRLIFKDFKKQLKNNQITWQLDRYDWNPDNSMSPHTFVGKLALDLKKFKKFSSLKITDAMAKNPDGTLQPLEIKIWRAKSTGSLVLEVGNAMIHSGTDMTSPSLFSRILGFGSNRTWPLLLKPLPFTIRDVRLNNIYDKLADLENKGQLPRTERGAADFEKSILLRQREKAICHILEQLVQQFSLRYSQEIDRYARKIRVYTFNPIAVPDEMAKNLGLVSGKEIRCQLTQEWDSEWRLEIESSCHVMINGDFNPIWARLNPFDQRRPAEFPMAKLVSMVKKSPKYIKPPHFFL